MKADKFIKSFICQDGRNVVLRTPKWEDLDGFTELINSLVDEEAEIVLTSKVTRAEETEWLTNKLSRLERDELFFLVAENHGQLVASAEIEVLSGDERHVGVLGVAVRFSFRGVGLGSEMIRTLVDQASLLGLKVLMLDVFATNLRAIHVYEKMGFKQVGRIPMKHFRKDAYIDEIIMAKIIP